MGKHSCTRSATSLGPALCDGLGSQVGEPLTASRWVESSDRSLQPARVSSYRAPADLSQVGACCAALGNPCTYWLSTGESGPRTVRRLCSRVTDRELVIRRRTSPCVMAGLGAFHGPQVSYRLPELVELYEVEMSKDIAKRLGRSPNPCGTARGRGVLGRY